MKQPVYYLVAVITAVLAVLLYAKTRQFDQSSYAHFADGLRRIEQLDTTFCEEVLKVRFKLVDNYDDFPHFEQELSSQTAKLRKIPTFVAQQDRTEILELLAAYDALLAKRTEMFEEFKSQNAVLNNSLSYLGATGEEMALHGNHHAGDDAHNEVNGFLRDTLLYSLRPDEDPADVERYLDWAKSWCAQNPTNADTPMVNNLTRHARTILTRKPLVERLTRELIALPTAEKIERVSQIYERNLTSALNRAGIYRAVLAVLVLVFLVGMVCGLMALRASNTRLVRTVTARTAQLAQEQKNFQSIFENSPEGIFQIDSEYRFMAANPALAAIYGYDSPGQLLEETSAARVELYVDPARRGEWRRLMDEEKVVREFKSEILCRDGSLKWTSETACPVTGPNGVLLYYQGFVVDITSEHQAEAERAMMEAHLRQSQKLESVGQLAAGIAHEINTPVQYIGDNLRFVKDAFVDLSRLVVAQNKLMVGVRTQTVTADLLVATETCSVEADFDYLNLEVPKAIDQALGGVKQVASIVQAMKEFSHPGQKDKLPTDLNHAIETTLTVARNEWKYVAEVVTHFAADLPPVLCLPDEFNQVILNLVVNAAHAIGDVIEARPAEKGTITITTLNEIGWAVIRIADTGGGIPLEVQHRIFEPFFTTKAVGKGTGQGLAIARATIVKKHGGELTFESTLGEGTTFIIRLPLTSPVTNY